MPDLDRTPVTVLVDEERIRQCVDSLALRITQDHPNGEPLVIVAIMKGALIFAADLVRRLRMPTEVEMVRARSYVGTRQSGQVQVGEELIGLDLARRHVLVVDCVFDSGQTLAVLKRLIAERGPASLKTCVLLRKACQRAEDVEPDYVGMDIPNVFVVGYGLDRAGRWRHLPFLAVPAEEPS